MGNRVKGRVKKKSIKAASSSRMGSTRKLSRMGKKQKKDNAGLAATFLSRSAVLKRLQLTLKDFRRLCILKGIYPRVPNKAPGKKAGQTFYHIRDVTYLSHEPLLNKFREFKSYMKKVRKAAGKDSKEEALRLANQKPTYTLHHLVRERYPRFQDALGDMDDALSLLSLFAALPGDGKVTPVLVARCTKLMTAFNAYVATTNSLTKTFVSVKGIYFEAMIQNVQVRWVVPHRFTQNVPKDVDIRVMSTFIEFYEVLLNFVLFKLYNQLNLRYPVAVVDKSEDDGGVVGLLRALKKGTGSITDIIPATRTESIVSASSKKNKKVDGMDIDAIVASTVDDEDDDGDESEDEQEDIAAPLTAALDSIDDVATDNTNIDANAARGGVFRNLTFFLSREVPRHVLEVVCLSYGATVGWEGKGSPILANDATITHHIVDRPALPASYSKYPTNREYVQPQWVLDSANFSVLLPCSKYKVGAELPPHLSPWIDNNVEGYTPKYAEEIEKIKRGEEIIEEDDSGDDAEEVPGSEAASDADDDDEDEDDDAVEEEEDIDVVKPKSDDPKELAKIMMSKKASRLYGRMQRGLQSRQDAVDNLNKKRAAIDKAEKEAKKAKKNIVVVSKKELEKIEEKEKISKRQQCIGGKGKNDEGKSIVKQKVERLKSKRKDLEKSFDNPVGMASKKKKVKKSKRGE